MKFFEKIKALFGAKKKKKDVDVEKKGDVLIHNKKTELTPEEKKAIKEEKQQKRLSSRIQNLSDVAKVYAANVSIRVDENGTEAVGIVFNEKSKVYMFGPAGNNLFVGDVVEVLDSSNTKRMVSVVMANQLVSDEYIIQPFKDIIRVIYHGEVEVEPEIAPQEILEEKLEEKKALEKTAESEVEETKAEEPVVEETPAEEPVVEETKTEEPVVEETPVEETKTEEPVVDEAPVEETKTEEPVVEETSVEETKTEEPVVEETPVEETKTEEPVVEVVPETEDETTDDSDDEEEAETDDNSADAPASDTQVEVTETGLYRITRVKKTKEAKISMLPDSIKDIYSEIYNKLISLGLTVSSTKTADKFKAKRNVLAQIKLTKSAVVLYLALDPQELENTKYKGKNVGDKKAYAATPFKYAVKTDRKCKWALELVDSLKTKNELTEVGYTKIDFKEKYPALTEEEYIEKGYITKTVEETTEAPKGFVKFEKIQ